MAVTQPAWAAVWVGGTMYPRTAGPGTYLFLGGPDGGQVWCWCCCPVPDVGWGGPVGTVYEGTSGTYLRSPSKMKQLAGWWSALTPADAPPPGLLLA